MRISFYLTRPRSSASTSIFARLCYSGLQLKFYTSETINPKFWNKETQRAKHTTQFREYPEFNRRLDNFSIKVKNIFRTWVNENDGNIPSTEVLRTLLNREFNKITPQHDESKTLLGFFEEIIRQTENGSRLQPSSGKRYSTSTIQVYKNTLNRLKEFRRHSGRKIDFETITVDFYTEFTGYLAKRLKLASNTIGKDIKTIKTVLNEATERGLNTNLQFKSRKFSVPSEITDAIYLSTRELESIEKLDLTSNQRLDNVRDLFLIGCYTGLRFSDCSVLTAQQIKNGFIEITQTKTGDPVVIPIHATVQRIISKHKGTLPPSISNQKTNEYLKELGKMKPASSESPVLGETISRSITKGGVKVITTLKKWQLLSTHTARRTFATNEFLAGTPTLTIMAITGHKTEKAFLRYIKLTSTEHAKLLQQHWATRQTLTAV